MTALDPPVRLAELEPARVRRTDGEAVIPAETYRRRHADALARGGARASTASPSMATASMRATSPISQGYDPRFEETLLVILPGGEPTLLVGNEGWGYAEMCRRAYERVLYQTFSLPGAAARPLRLADPHPAGAAESRAGSLGASAGSLRRRRPWL